MNHIVRRGLKSPWRKINYSVTRTWSKLAPSIFDIKVRSLSMAPLPIFKRVEGMQIFRRLSVSSIDYNKSSHERGNLKTEGENLKTEGEEKQNSSRYALIMGSAVVVIGMSYVVFQREFKKNKAKAESGHVSTVAENMAIDVTEEIEEEKQIHKSKAGFRERKIIEYENRVRAYSTPDKIFRYFATLQDGKTGDIYMLPEDFVRSLTPDTMQPEGLGLDEFKRIERKKQKPYASPLFGEDSVFRCLGSDGLITFPDYVFLLTVLGTPTRHISIAFRMFDLNGDGEVSMEEFKKVNTVLLTMTSTGSRHRDRKTTGNVLGSDVNMGLVDYFFGADGKNKLTIDKFIEFKQGLQKEVMKLEFNSYSPVNDRIKEIEFCEILLTYATLTDLKRGKMIHKIKNKFKESEGITFDDYLDFFSFLLNIRDVNMALSFHTVSGQGVTPEHFQQVAKTVAGVDLRDHLVQVVFELFDDNEDGQLSNKEFVSVMKQKIFRGLNKSKDTGLTRFLSAIWTCSKNQVQDIVAAK